MIEASIQVAVISAAASIVVASLSVVWSKHAERKAAHMERQLTHYKALLSALSDLAVDGTDKDEANLKFALAVNTIALVAPQPVVTALMVYHDEVRFSNTQRSQDAHDRKLNNLLLEIRRSLALPFKDDPRTFRFHFVGASPKNQQKESVSQQSA